MFGHYFLGLVLVDARSNAFAIGKNEPVIQANFPDDVLGHFERPGSEQIPPYDSSVAGPLTPIR